MLILKLFIYQQSNLCFILKMFNFQGGPSMSQTALDHSARSWPQGSDGSNPAGIMLLDFPTIGRICISADIQDKVGLRKIIYRFVLNI